MSSDQPQPVETLTSRVGILTTESHPLAGAIAEQIDQIEGVEAVLILDARDFTDKDLGIFRERTGGLLEFHRPVDVLDRISSLRVENHNSDECLSSVDRLGIDVLLNGGTPRRIQTALLQSPPLGVVNVHPGILPKYRGSCCPEWAIHNDDPVGHTAHFMDEGLDSGPILFTETLAVPAGQTYAELRAALYRQWQTLCARAVSMVTSQRLQASDLPPQPDAPAFSPISDHLLAEVKQKLVDGQYTSG